MKKYILLFICAVIFGLTSCEELKEELGLKDPDKDQNDNKEDQKPPQNVNKSPCAYFTFDGNYEDLSGTGKNDYGNPDPTFVNGPTTGKKAIAFSRANNTKVVVNDGLIDSPSMTLSFWLKDISEGDICYVTTSNNSKMMSLAYKNGHLKYVMTRDHVRYSYNQYGDFTHKAIDDGDWHHIVLVSDFNTLTPNAVTLFLYVDGVLMDTLTEGYSASSENDQSNRHFGAGTKFVMGGDNTPNMKIANLRVYDEWQLPESEIKNLYTKKL